MRCGINKGMLDLRFISVVGMEPSTTYSAQSQDWGPVIIFWIQVEVKTMISQQVNDSRHDVYLYDWISRVYDSI